MAIAYKIGFFIQDNTASLTTFKYWASFWNCCILLAFQNTQIVFWKMSNCEIKPLSLIMANNQLLCIFSIYNHNYEDLHQKRTMLLNINWSAASSERLKADFHVTMKIFSRKKFAWNPVVSKDCWGNFTIILKRWHDDCQPNFFRDTLGEIRHKIIIHAARKS